MGVIDQRIEALAASQYGVFAVRQLDGIDPRAVAARKRDGRLRRLYRGVYATGPYLPIRGRLLAAVLASGPHAVLSHRPAGPMWDINQWKGGPIDVTLTEGRTRRRRGINPHRANLVARDKTRIDGIPVTSLARTLLDLASIATPTQLQRAYESAEHAQALDVTAIADLLARSNGHHGIAPLTALLTYDPTAAAGAASELERLFLDLLRKDGLPLPLTNVLVDGYLVDCYWPAADLVVELDSYEFHGDREAFERDRAKVADLRRASHEAVQFTYRQVTARAGWVAGTTRALLAAARPRRSL